VLPLVCSVAVLVPHLFESTNQIERFLRRYLLLLIPVCILGSAQFISPTDSPINRYAFMAEEQNVASFGDEEGRARGDWNVCLHHRPRDVSASDGSAVVNSVLPASFDLSGMLSECCQYVLIIGNVLMSGSRGPAFLIVGMTVAFMVFRRRKAFNCDAEAARRADHHGDRRMLGAAFRFPRCFQYLSCSAWKALETRRNVSRWWMLEPG
jgi:hypothetical protein